MQSDLLREGTMLRIRTPIPVVVRIAGIPFLLLGLWLLRTLCGSIADVLHGLGTLGEMLPGQLLLIVMTLSFLVPGVLMCFAGRELVLDAAGKVARESISVLGVGKNNRRSLDAFERVRVAQRLKRQRGSRDTVTYDVELVGRRGEMFLVALADAPKAALQLGLGVAEYVKLPLEDHTGSDPENDD